MVRAAAPALVLPRVGTPRDTSRPTLGPLLLEVMRGLGYAPHDWQGYAGDVSLQLRRRPTGRGRARVSPWRLQARTVGVLLGRQGGKTALAEARAWLSCLLPDLDGVAELVGAPVGPQRVAWLAQDRASALRSWLEALDRLMASPYAGLIHRPRLQRGDEVVRFTNGSTLRVVTPSRLGPRGQSLDCIVLDEGLAHPAELLSALAPTQAQRDGAAGSIGAQLVALSSAPEDERRSTLLVALREQGRRAVAERATTSCWLEWSAEPGCDPYDEAQWRLACPTLDRPGGISSEFLRLQAETLDVSTFGTEYLSLPGAGPTRQCIDLDAWARAPQVDVADELTLAIDGRPNSESATIVGVGRAGDIIGVEVIEHADGVDWVQTRVVDIARRWNARVVVDRGGPLGWLIPALEHADGVKVLSAGAGDVLTAAAMFAADVSNGLIAHDRDPRLDEAVQAAVRRRAGDRWAFDRTAAVDLSPLVACSLGVWALHAHKLLIPAIH